MCNDLLSALSKDFQDANNLYFRLIKMDDNSSRMNRIINKSSDRQNRKFLTFIKVSKLTKRLDLARTV